MEERSPFEGIDDPILRVQMEHEMRAIEELVFVTKLSFVPAHKDKAEGFRATLGNQTGSDFTLHQGDPQG